MPPSWPNRSPATDHCSTQAHEAPELAGSVRDASATDPPHLPGDPGDPCRPLRCRLPGRIGLVAARPGQEPRPPLASPPRRSGVRTSARKEPAPLDLLRNPQPLCNHAPARYTTPSTRCQPGPDRPIRDGWPLHLLENAGRFMVAEP